MVQLADTINQCGDFRAELTVDLLQRGLRVLNDVVQDGGADGLRIEAHVREFLGDRHRMSYVRLARLSSLALMRRGTELVSVHDGLDLLLGQIRLERFDQLPQTVVALGRPRQFR